MPSNPRRIAAIDIGTNSIHMIVAEATRRGWRVVDKEKEMVQLGLSSLDGAPLEESAMDRGIAAVARMAEVARGWDVSEIHAVATSAVREAANRREFLRRVREAAGLKVRVISGEEEADYIFRAVRSVIDLNGGTALCIDIGGGSVECIIGTSSEVYYTASQPLGSLRLAQRFHLQDLPAPDDVEACRRLTAARLRPVQKQVKAIGIDCAVGTSGTVQALALLAAPPDAAPSVTRSLSREALAELVADLVKTSLADRVSRFGLEEKRAATIVAGGIVLLTAMEAFGVDSLVSCAVAMREGIIESQAGLATPAAHTRSMRQASVTSLATRSECDRRHGRHVAMLAARIFDQTKRLHALPPESRELLEHAAFLHEVGMHVSDRGYHKHTYYLIRHAALRGFTEDELVVVANVARYHRKTEPEDGDPNLEELTAAQRGDVLKLAAILRIAEALDRSHRQAVRDVAVRCNGSVQFFVRTRSDAAVELEAAEKRARYFSKLFERKVRFEVV